MAISTSPGSARVGIPMSVSSAASRSPSISPS
jgi:hypothetical protein